MNGLGISSLMSLPVINDSGEIAFRAERFNLTDFHHGFGAWSINEWGAISEIAHEGMTVPGSPDELDGIAYISGPGSGHSAFHGWVDCETIYAPPLTTGVWATNDLGEVRLVAEYDSPAPGTNRLFGNFYHPYTLRNLSFKVSETGRVALISGVYDPTGVEPYQYGVWREDAFQQLQLVALDSAPLPGATDGTMLRRLKSLSPLVTDQGHVAFLAYSSGPQEDDRWRIGIWREQHDNHIAAVANAMDPVPGWRSTLYIKDITAFSINNRGDTAFFAYTRETPEPLESGWIEGMWVATSDGEKKLIAMEGAPVPGLSSVVFSKWRLGIDISVGGEDAAVLVNGRGDVAFVAQLEGPSIHSGNDSALFLRRADGDLAIVAREGDQAPNGKTLTSMLPGETSFSFNSLGQIAFIQSGRDVLWGYDHYGKLIAIAESGQAIDVDNGPAVDMRTLGELSMLAGSGGEDGGRSGFNDRGQIVFHANLGSYNGGILLSNAMAVPEPSVASIMGALVISGICRRPAR